MKSLIIFFALAAVVLGQGTEEDYDPCKSTGQKSGYLADLRDCTAYWGCTSDFGYKFNCPDGYVFDEFNTECTLRTATNCPAPFCPKGTTGAPFNVRVPGQCTKYRACVLGNIFERECAPDTAFDDTKGQCDKTFKADCLNCPRETTRVVRLPDKKDCGGYYVCSKGKATSQKCAEGNFYDEKDQVCRKAELVVCAYSEFQTEPPEGSGEGSGTLDIVWDSEMLDL